MREPDFISQMEQIKPDGILVSCFGQRLPEPLLDLVQARAFNIHPVVPGEGLEATRGPRPLARAIKMGAKQIQIAIHRMSAEFDNGEIVARGRAIDLPPDLQTWITNTGRNNSEILAFWKTLSQTIPSVLDDKMPSLF